MNVRAQKTAWLAVGPAVPLSSAARRNRFSRGGGFGSVADKGQRAAEAVIMIHLENGVTLKAFT
jgi:hypothetical protein